MSVNRFRPHVYVIPEDRADAEIADGFVLHDQVKQRQIQVMPWADGWPGVLEKFRTEYISHLRKHNNGYVILLIDFDNKYETQRAHFNDQVPQDLKDRVFVVGVKETPEALKQLMGVTLEDIGLSLAEDCYKGTVIAWGHEHLKHNEPDRVRLAQIVRSILFAN